MRTTESAPSEDRATRNTERTRRAVLDATVDLLAEHGSGVTLKDIAAKAGVSKSGLLHHFPTRDDLFRAVAADAIEHFRVDVLGFVDLAENHPGKVLRAYVRALCGGSEEAVHFFAYSGVWNAIQSVPGVAEASQADNDWWAQMFAQDGLHPDRILLVQYAAEGMAAATHFDSTMTPTRLAAGREMLLALTLPESPPVAG